MTERFSHIAGGHLVAYEDRTLTCVDCKAPFIFSARDQEFHAQKGFTNEPKRCPSCRAAKRNQRGEGAPSGAPRAVAAGAARQPVYTGPRAQPKAGGRDERGRGGPRDRRGGFDRGGRREGRDGERAGTSQRSFGGESPSNTYMAACSACGKETPASADSGNHVVFCSECYEKMTALTRS
jgi:hypothetical protein